MGKLACNIVSYRPDPDMLAANFRFWDVEALLGEAATLIERCLKDFKEYSALDYAWNQLQTDLETQEKQLILDIKCEAEYAFGREGVPLLEEGAPKEAEEKAEEPEPEPAGEPEEAGEAEEAGEVEAAEEKPEEQPVESDEHLPFAKRNLNLRERAVLRKKELASPGRPFALDEQRDLVLQRLCRDYEEAVNRAVVAEEGLKKIYAHQAETSPLSNEAETLGTSITNLSIWVRSAVEWLAGYQKQEQAFTRVVSLRALLNRSVWVQLKQARDSYSLKLDIPKDLFRGFDNCRLKGVGASIIGEAGKVPWSINLRLPELAVYERAGEFVEIDQSALPTCLLGRVENRRATRALEVCCETTLNNASPIAKSYTAGQWSIEIFKPAGSATETFGHVEDIVLEINVVGVPQKSGS